MKLHKEGYVTVVVAFIVLFGLAAGLIYFLPSFVWLRVLILLTALFFYFRAVSFFRVPKRNFSQIESAILSPADGEIVAIEEVFEAEYLNAKCIQISVFMSPRDVHINWMPASGKISYYKYHPGKHLVAWHPKSSHLNERTSIGLELNSGTQLFFRQIAGALARRIVCYAKVGLQMNQTDEMGFIKFGSRVDVFLPLDAKINVKMKDVVVGGQSILARLD